MYPITSNLIDHCGNSEIYCALLMKINSHNMERVFTVPIKIQTPQEEKLKIMRRCEEEAGPRGYVEGTIWFEDGSWSQYEKWRGWVNHDIPKIPSMCVPDLISSKSTKPVEEKEEKPGFVVPKELLEKIRDYLDETEEEDLAERLDAILRPVYCPTCGSCGEDGCCSPDVCETVQERMYCEGNLKSYHELLHRNKQLEEELGFIYGKIKRLRDGLTRELENR